MSEQIVREVLAAFANGDGAALYNALAEDSVMALGAAPAEEIPWLGTHKGRDAIMTALGTIASYLEVNGFAPKEIIMKGDRVVCFIEARYTVRATGKQFVTYPIDVITVRDGKIVHTEGWDDTLYAAKMLKA